MRRTHLRGKLFTFTSGWDSRPHPIALTHSGDHTPQDVTTVTTVAGCGTDGGTSDADLAVGRVI